MLLKVFRAHVQNFVVVDLRPVHICMVCHTVTTTHSLETACGQIEHIEINHDAYTDAVRLLTGRACAVCQYDTFFIGFFKILIFY